MFNLKLKRVLAAALSALCVLTLASCGNAGTNGSESDSEIVSGTEFDSSVTVDNIKNEDVILTIGGEPVDYEEYRYFYLNSKNDMDGGDANYWTENPDAAETLKANTLNTLAQFHAITITANEMGVEITDEDKAATDETINLYIDSYTEETFNSMLEESYLTLDLFKHLNNITALETHLYDAIIADGTKFPSDEATVKEMLMGDDYIRAMHILYSDKATAEGVLEEAQNATDDEFYELAQSAEDGGMVGNTAGYCFTKGEMIQEFEDASFALEVGETSGLVESMYGYHIIRRLEKTPEYIDENYETLSASYLQNGYYKYLNDYALEIVDTAEFSPVYESLGIDTVK